MLDDAVFIYKGFDFTGLIRAGVHSLQRHGHIVVCSNSRCHEGGYDLQPELTRDDVPEIETEGHLSAVRGIGDEYRPTSH